MIWNIWIIGMFCCWQTNLPEYQGPEKIVIRRYSDFVWLRDRLFEKYKGIFVPPLPEKSAVGNEFAVSFSSNTSLYIYSLNRENPWICC